MKRVKTILMQIGRSKLLKYLVVTILGIVIVGFADDNSIWNHYRNKRKIADLQSEIKKYRSQYEHDQARLKSLESNPKAIEKIARENYFMKTDDEDIFVLSDDERQPQQQPDETTE
jgi:cell division protein DivIC